MKLRALTISNFATIGEPGLTIPIDDIVVLIGPNNSGKSSVLNAYEAFSSTGSALSLKAFRDEDPSKTISIDGLFTDLTDNDRETLGAKWEYDDPTYGRAVRAKWEWTVPDQKAQKYSWDSAGGKWISGGMGGWDTLITSRIPVPLRIRPTDDPEETEKQIVEILTAAAKAALKKDATKGASVLKELQTLADEFAKDAQKELDDACSRITKKNSTTSSRDTKSHCSNRLVKLIQIRSSPPAAIYELKNPERLPFLSAIRGLECEGPFFGLLWALSQKWAA